MISRNSRELCSGQIFGSTIVDEVKGKETATPCEKSRLVIQAFNDEVKKTVATQSSTIQRVSQRIVAALAPSLKEQGITLHLRDLTQAYVQSTTTLVHAISARPPKEVLHELPPKTIFKVIRPLYGIPEAGTHWFGTYHKHHREKLFMETSTFDPCLLITKGTDGSLSVNTWPICISRRTLFRAATLELQKYRALAACATARYSLSDLGTLYLAGTINRRLGNIHFEENGGRAPSNRHKTQEINSIKSHE